MEVTNLKSVIDEMDYDCRKKDPVHYNNIINNLKNLHSLCKTEEDRELFMANLSAATSPSVLVDLGLAELKDADTNMKDVTKAVNEVSDEVVKSAQDLTQMQANATAEREVVAHVTGTNKDEDYDAVIPDIIPDMSQDVSGLTNDMNDFKPGDHQPEGQIPMPLPDDAIDMEPFAFGGITGEMIKIEPSDFKTDSDQSMEGSRSR